MDLLFRNSQDLRRENHLSQLAYELFMTNETTPTFSITERLQDCSMHDFSDSANVEYGVENVQCILKKT